MHAGLYAILGTMACISVTSPAKAGEGNFAQIKTRVIYNNDTGVSFKKETKDLPPQHTENRENKAALSTSAPAAIEPASGTPGTDKELAQSFTFGEPEKALENIDTQDVSPETDTQEQQGLASNLKFSGALAVKAGFMFNDEAPADVTTHESIKPEIEWSIDDGWMAKASYDIDYFSENGSEDFSNLDLRYNEIYVKHTGDNYALTLGSQKVVWGSVDDTKPTDQLGAQDLRTFILNDYEDRREAVPALRGEYYAGDYKLDGLFVFSLRESEMADTDSAWSFIDTSRDRIAGIDIDPSLTSVLNNASIGEDNDGIGGGGVRVSRKGQHADAALTVQRARRTLPYYEVNPQIISSLRSGASVATALASSSGDIVTETHPWTWVVGGDIAVPIGRTVIRAEGAWLSDVPVYKTDLSKDFVDSFLMVAGAEMYPGDGDLQIILQASAQILSGANNTLDRKEVYAVNGTIENEFFQGVWVAGIDYAFGLNKKDIYLNPGVTYKGIDNHEIFLEGHYFEGAPDTLGDYFHHNSIVMAGWKYHF